MRGNTLVIATATPDNLRCSTTSIHAGCQHARLCVQSVFDRALEQYYKMQDVDEGLQDWMDSSQREGEVDLDAYDIGDLDSMDMSDIGSAAESAPVRKLLDLILLTAVKAQASDIHFEPFEDTFRVRNRIDGVLYEMLPVPKALSGALVARIKVMSASTSPSVVCCRMVRSRDDWWPRGRPACVDPAHHVR